MTDRILVLEDEPNVGLTLVERLRAESFEVAWARTVAEAMSELARQAPTLALLDVGLPDGSGFDVAERIRRDRPGTAVIFLTALGGAEDRVRGLELGAEDYVTKPFHLRELLLRIRNGLRRAQALSALSAATPEVTRLGVAEIDFAAFEARTPTGTHRLTHREAALLRLLLERAGRVVSRDEILDEVWSESEFPTPRTVDNFVLRLRRLLEPEPENPTIIRSVRGVGYLLEKGTKT